MKRLNVTDLGALRSELTKDKQGRTLEPRQFNQAARLAWLGKAVLQPLDPEHPAGEAWLLYLECLDGIAEQCVLVDDELLHAIHFVDAAQGAALAAIVGEGSGERAAAMNELNRRDFHAERAPGKR